jgi:hypothetical protein
VVRGVPGRRSGEFTVSYFFRGFPTCCLFFFVFVASLMLFLVVPGFQFCSFLFP